MTARTDIVNTAVDQRGKAAFRALVSASGGQDGAAATTGRSQQRISLLGHPNSDVFPTIKDVRELEAVSHGTAGHPLVTRSLAREAGFELFRLPSPKFQAMGWTRLMAGISAESGEVFQKVCIAIDDDGDVSASEARECLKEVDELIEVAVRLRATLALVLEDE